MSSSGKVSGVSLGSNICVEADAVVVNADLLYAYRELLPSACTGLNRSKNISCSSISFYWSLSKKVPQLETHNMFVGESFGNPFTQVYVKRRGSTGPSFYVHVPSRIDSSAAPAGKDAVIVLVLVQNLGGSDPKHNPCQKDEIRRLVTDVREQVILSIEKRISIVGFRELIDHEIINTPLTWQETFNSEGGGIFGLDHSFFNILAFRPKIKHESIDGLYFVGASTHPGAGVPTCLAGAKLTAERVLQDLNIPAPWEDQNTKGSRATVRHLFFKSPWKWIIFIVGLYVTVGVVLGGTP